MKVYVVVSMNVHGGDFGEIFGVFASRAQAQAVIDSGHLVVSRYYTLEIEETDFTAETPNDD